MVRNKDYAKAAKKKYRNMQKRFEESFIECNKRYPTLDHLKLEPLKSKIQGLLWKIESKIKEAEKDIEIEKKEGDSEMIVGYKFRKTAFEEMKDLVRKWFADVFEDERK